MFMKYGKFSPACTGFYLVGDRRCLLLFSIFSFICVLSFAQPAEASKRIIFDTDIATDYDDVGALALLYRLQADGECEVLATMASTNDPRVPVVLRTINNFYGHANIPVGTAVPGSPRLIAENGWVDSLLYRYPLKMGEGELARGAVQLYRKILSQVRGDKVTIVVVGFLSNLEALLDSGPDEYSRLSGQDLIAKTVDQLVVMGGAFPQGREYNIYQDPKSAIAVFNRWPARIVCSGFEIGSAVLTGSVFSREPKDNDPVNWAYRYNMSKREEHAHPSWDQVTVLAAVREVDQYFDISTPGKITIDSCGSNVWQEDVDGNHFYLKHRRDTKEIEQLIDELMISSSKK